MQSYTYKDKTDNPKTLVVLNDYSTAILHYYDYAACNAANVLYAVCGDYTLKQAITRLADMKIKAKSIFGS